MQRLHEMEPRTLVILIVCSFMVTLFGAYRYLLKPDVSALANLREEEHGILDEFEPQKAAQLETQIRTLQAEIKALSAALYGQGGRMTPSQLVSYVIAKLDGLSSRHRVQLVSVKPESGTRVALFEETPFSIELKGSYRDLYAWLQDAEHELHPMVIKQFQIASSGSVGAPLSMAVRVVSYRLLEHGV